MHTVERAVAVEGLGYHRFWVAEHHGVPGVASGAPAVLLAAVGAHTATIRLGSGGVMLPHHQPMVVAEQFLMLAGLYPGRIDLGLGRSLGFTPPVRRALRRSADEPDTFADDVVELRSYLERTALRTSSSIALAPLGGRVPPGRRALILGDTAPRCQGRRRRCGCSPTGRAPAALRPEAGRPVPGWPLP